MQLLSTPSCSLYQTIISVNNNSCSRNIRKTQVYLQRFKFSNFQLAIPVKTVFIFQFFEISRTLFMKSSLNDFSLMNKYAHVKVFSHRSAVLECCRDVEISSMLYKEAIYRSSPAEMFLRKGILKICNKFTREDPCRSCFATLVKSHFDMGVLL